MHLVHLALCHKHVEVEVLYLFHVSVFIRVIFIII